MTFNEYQSHAHKTAVYKNYLYPYLGLAEEAGEVCGKMKKHIRDKTDYEDFRQALKKELGDVLWYIAEIASDNGLTLQEVADANVEKLHNRIQSKTIHGSGDDR